jgi:hypothetical protein
MCAYKTEKTNNSGLSEIVTIFLLERVMGTYTYFSTKQAQQNFGSSKHPKLVYIAGNSRWRVIICVIRDASRSNGILLYNSNIFTTSRRNDPTVYKYFGRFQLVTFCAY